MGCAGPCPRSWRWTNRANTKHYADGSTSLVIHEGLIFFTDDVVNALFASAQWRDEQMALPLDAPTIYCAAAMPIGRSSSTAIRNARSFAQ